jgi:hypothetical protein
MSRSSAVDLSALSDPSTGRFLEQLKQSVTSLSAAQSSEFFNIVMSHFGNSRALSTRAGARILATVQSLLDMECHRVAFVSGGHALALPCNDPRFLGNVLNVFSTLVTLSPQLITNEIAQVFRRLIPKDPTKCLVLIAKYAKRFGELTDPWGLLDLLIHNAADFTNPDIIGDYVRLLCYLCYEFPEYLAVRVQHCWNQIASMLVSDDVTTITCCYNGLCALARKNPDGILHMDVVSLHLVSEDTVESALSILSLKPVSPRVFNESPQFFPNLIRAATKTVHATLVLMELAKSHSGALQILGDTQWLLLPLPQIIDTIRLFLVVFQHRSLRSRFLSIPQFVPFLQVLVSLKDPGILSIVATIFRRIQTTATDVQEISASGLFREFASVAKELRDTISIGAALLVADSIAHVTFVEDLEAFCEIVARALSNEGELATRASFVAERLAKYPQCAKRLKRRRTRGFVDEQRRRPETQRSIKRRHNASPRSAKQ